MGTDKGVVHSSRDWPPERPAGPDGPWVQGPPSLAGVQQSWGLPDVIYQTMTTFNVRSVIISFILIQSFPVELSRVPTAIFNRGIFLLLLRLDTVITVELSVFVEGN